MKNRVWLLQIPVILVYTGLFLVGDLGARGELNWDFLRTNVLNSARRVSALFTDFKFIKIRGPQPAKNKIVIVEVDSPSIDALGRWPWHRDTTAYLIEKTFEAGAKVVGMDIVFSEPDKRVPDDLAKLIEAKAPGLNLAEFETDQILESVIRKYKDRLVLGAMTEMFCQPKFSKKEDCPVTDPEIKTVRQEGFERYSFESFVPSAPFDIGSTPLSSVVTTISNILPYTQASVSAGFLNASGDPDSVIRRAQTFMMIDGKPYPSLGLAMAKVGMGETLELKLDERNLVKTLSFAKSGKTVQVSPLGVMDINFRGKGRTFPYVSALEIMNDEEKIKGEITRELAGISKKDLLRDAYVLIGVTALGVNDRRAFPFEDNGAGTEGHANILDNILSGDALIPTYSGQGSIIVFVLMVLGGIGFAYFSQKLEAIPALLLFLITFGGLSGADAKLLFANNYNWDTGWLYLEFFTIFVFTIAAKYVIEERNKKFLKSAMARYVAPAVVDQIIKDPEKLTLGGEKKDLTILFSDIRGFTTFSERMDAKALASFLNDYLETMTDTIFKEFGTVDKYIGDAIMAFWGAPLDQPKHGLMGCQAAIAMVKALDANRERFKQQYNVDVETGIGLNSGLVTVGNMGSKDKMNYTVIGDHVNLASRLEGLTKYYSAKIITSRFTFDQITQSAEKLPAYRVLDHVKVKGKKNAVELIEVMTDLANAEGLKLFEEGRGFYSRQKWDQAIDAFQAALQKFGTDGPSQLYIERCQDFKINPPEANWDGSWEMTSK